jgi:hypothetical protein
MIDARSGTRFEPASEGEEVAALLGSAGPRIERADDDWLLVAVFPNDGALAFRGRQRFQLGNLGIQRRHPGAQVDVLARRTAAFADEPKSRGERRGHCPREKGELHHFRRAQRS